MKWIHEITFYVQKCIFMRHLRFKVVFHLEKYSIYVLSFPWRGLKIYASFCQPWARAGASLNAPGQQQIPCPPTKTDQISQSFGTVTWQFQSVTKNIILKTALFTPLRIFRLMPINGHSMSKTSAEIKNLNVCLSENCVTPGNCLGHLCCHDSPDWTKKDCICFHQLGISYSISVVFSFK